MLRTFFHSLSYPAQTFLTMILTIVALLTGAFALCGTAHAAWFGNPIGPNDPVIGIWWGIQQMSDADQHLSSTALMEVEINSNGTARSWSYEYGTGHDCVALSQNGDPGHIAKLQTGVYTFYNDAQVSTGPWYIGTLSPDGKNMSAGTFGKTPGGSLLNHSEHLTLHKLNAYDGANLATFVGQILCP